MESANNIQSQVYESFDFFHDARHPNKTAVCIIPKIQHTLNINISELISSHNHKHQGKLHTYVICDMSSSMKEQISHIPLQNVIYNDRRLNIPENISRSRTCIAFSTIALISHILQKESLCADIKTNLNIIPFSNDVHECITFTNIEDINQHKDIDYTVFDYLANKCKTGVGTRINKALKYTNDKIQELDPDEMKIVIILTDGAFNNEVKAIHEYEQLNNNPNIAVGCVAMGKNTRNNMIKRFNIGEYFYMGDFLSGKKEESILDIIPHVLYNLLHEVFSNYALSSIFNVELGLKDKYIEGARKKRKTKPRKSLEEIYKNCEIFKYGEYEVEIWNVESDNDEYETDDDDKIRERENFKSGIIYPINNINKAYIGNCMTPIYALIYHDINPDITVTVNENNSFQLDYSSIEDNIQIIDLLEINDKLNGINSTYDKNIFSNILHIKRNLKVTNIEGHDYLHKKKLEELKKLNNMFVKHYNILSKFEIKVMEYKPTNQHEYNLKMFTICRINDTTQKMSEKKLEMFNPRNKNELYTESSIRHASHYKSIMLLKKVGETIPHICCDSTLCKICLDDKSIVCNINCGHIATCGNLECMKYIENINKCIVCRTPISNISGIFKIELDEYAYDCISCRNTNLQDQTHKVNCVRYLFECGHVGFCDDCTQNKDVKIFSCHRCKKKVKILCSIYI